MATKMNSPKNLRLEEDEIVGKVVGPGETVADAIFLTGFLSRGTDGDCWRLYKVPELREYIEFKESDVIHCEKTESDLLPAKASLVWLKSDAVLQCQTAKTRSIAAEFLSGLIVADQGIGSGAGAVATSVTAVATWTVTATAAGIPHSAICNVTKAPLCLEAPASLGICGSGCNLCGVSVPK